MSPAARSLAGYHAADDDKYLLPPRIWDKATALPRQVILARRGWV